ncbi:hypothetical protein [uncultured Jannaschia sp.]|uniref:hypothetical protein n=1 Tax=uncultured Jannaschia sp. TaxID=293347 RepID=UPI0034495593
MSLQTIGAHIIFAAFGRRLGFATIALFFAKGAVGSACFSNTPERGIGLAYMFRASAAIS